MSYWFERYKYGVPILVKGQSLDLFLGDKRLGPRPKIVWWYPPNIVFLLALIVASPVAIYTYYRTKKRVK